MIKSRNDTRTDHEQNDQSIENLEQLLTRHLQSLQHDSDDEHTNISPTSLFSYYEQCLSFQELKQVIDQCFQELQEWKSKCLKCESSLLKLQTNISNWKESLSHVSKLLLHNVEQNKVLSRQTVSLLSRAQKEHEEAEGQKSKSVEQQEATKEQEEKNTSASIELTEWEQRNKQLEYEALRSLFADEWAVNTIQSLLDVNSLYSKSLSDFGALEQKNHVDKSDESKQWYILLNSYWNEYDLEKFEHIVKGPIVVPYRSMMNVVKHVMVLSKVLTEESNAWYRLNDMIHQLSQLSNILSEKSRADGSESNWLIANRLFETLVHPQVIVNMHIVQRDKRKLVAQIQSIVNQVSHILQSNVITDQQIKFQDRQFKRERIWTTVLQNAHFDDSCHLFYRHYSRVGMLSDVLLAKCKDKASSRTPKQVDLKSELLYYLLKKPKSSFIEPEYSNGIALFELNERIAVLKTKPNNGTQKPEVKSSDEPTNDDDSSLLRSHIAEAVIKRLKKLKARSAKRQLSSDPGRFERYELRTKLRQFILQSMSIVKLLNPIEQDKETTKDRLFELLAYDYERIKLFRFLLKRVTFLQPDSVLLIQKSNLIKHYALLSPEQKHEQFLHRYYRIHYHLNKWNSIQEIEAYEALVLSYGKRLIRQHEQYQRTSNQSSKAFFKCMDQVLSASTENALLQCEGLHDHFILQSAQTLSLLDHFAHSPSSVQRTTKSLVLHYRHYFSSVQFRALAERSTPSDRRN